MCALRMRLRIALRTSRQKLHRRGILCICAIDTDRLIARKSSESICIKVLVLPLPWHAWAVPLGSPPGLRSVLRRGKSHHPGVVRSKLLLGIYTPSSMCFMIPGMIGNHP